MNKPLHHYPDDLLASVILDLSSRRWLDDWSAQRLEDAKEEQRTRRERAGGKQAELSEA